MKQIVLMLIFLMEMNIVYSQVQMYYDLPQKMDARYEIDINNSKKYNTDTINFKIESLVLLKTKKSWKNNELKLITIDNQIIYAKDATCLFLFDIKGNPIRKIDLSKIDKNFKLRDLKIFKDTLFLVDNRSLLLLKYTRQGDFISKKALIFNFEDFQINESGMFFISKHYNDPRIKTIRISLFDFSLNILKQYFVTDRHSKNKYELSPEFYKGEGDDILFSITASNQIYNLENEGVSLYLKVTGGHNIINYAQGAGFHFLIEMPSDDGDYTSHKLIPSYYFPNRDLQDGIMFPGYSDNDLSKFLLPSETLGIYQNNYVSIINMDYLSIPVLMDLKWAENHKYIKNELLQLINQLDENRKFIVVLYKIIDN